MKQRALVLTFFCLTQLMAWLGLGVQESKAFDLSPLGLPSNSTIPSFNNRPNREPTLQEMFPRGDFYFPYQQAVQLKGIKIPGLNEKAVSTLGFGYFVVVPNTSYNSFTELYRDNRLKGKSSFITADSVIHPYLAFTNRIKALTVEQKIVPQVYKLLQAMVISSYQDYKQADDAGVRDDIERNIAFLTVGLKLLDANYVPPNLSRITSLVDNDLKAIKAGKTAKSLIFDREEQFSFYQPLGWYNASQRLQNFYRCREWISRMYLPMNDVSFGGNLGGSNNFRRAVLLYRSLDLATIDGRPAYDTWLQLYKVWSFFGTPIGIHVGQVLLAKEMKLSDQGQSRPLDMTLQALSEPLYRTKLMLSIRNSNPLNLNATSIFDLSPDDDIDKTSTSFHLMPVVEEPEIYWLRTCNRGLAKNNNDLHSWPLGLLVLHGRAAGQANTILSNNLGTLDPKLTKWVPKLDRSLVERTSGGQLKRIDNRYWEILSAYFKQLPEGVPPVLRSEAWLTRNLESAFAGWIDGHIVVATNNNKVAPADTASGTTNFTAGGTVAPVAPPKAPEVPVGPHAELEEKAKNVVIQTGTPKKELAPKPIKPATFHYLEPNAEIYRRLRQDAAKFSSDLATLGFFNESYRTSFDDFTKLFSRLELIAGMEQRQETLPPQDMSLLANFDLVLEKIDVTLPGVLSLSSLSGDDACATFALGKAGQVYMIVQHDYKAILLRGGAYTLYEFEGQSFTKEEWLQKLNSETISPPFWTQSFDIVSN